MGASTPHFALQLRERIAKLIAGLPAESPGAHRRRARDRAPASASAWPARSRGEPGAPGEHPLPSLDDSATAGATLALALAGEHPLAARVCEARAQQFEEQREQRQRERQRSDLQPDRHRR